MHKVRRGILPTGAILVALTLLLLVQPAAAQEEGSIFHVEKESVPPGIDREFEFRATQLSVPFSVDLDEYTFYPTPGDSDEIKNPSAPYTKWRRWCPQAGRFASTARTPGPET